MQGCDSGRRRSRRGPPQRPLKTNTHTDTQRACVAWFSTERVEERGLRRAQLLLRRRRPAKREAQRRGGGGNGEQGEVVPFYDDTALHFVKLLLARLD